MDKQQNNENRKLFDGVKVIDLTRAIAGPTCTVFLADMGAEVIKIQEPGAYNPRDLIYFNRNKKGVTLNLKTEKGKEIMRRFILWGDVLVENYRPGVMKKMGFDYPEVKKINPRIIMTSISGFGQTGPYAHRGCFDTIGQAMGGLMSLIGPAEGHPWDSNTPLSDISTGVFGALGTVMALYHQQATGMGQHVEASLVDSIVHLLAGSLIDHFKGNPPRKGEAWFWEKLPGAGWFKSKDGRWIVIMAQTKWAQIAPILGRPDLVDAPGYRSREERSRNSVAIHDIMEQWTSAKTLDEIEDMLEKGNIPFGRVQDLSEVLNDPGLRARGMFKDVNIDGEEEVIPLFGPYPQLSETPGSYRTPAPRIGEHNEEIYCGIMGFSKEELSQLKDEGII